MNCRLNPRRRNRRASLAPRRVASFLIFAACAVVTAGSPAPAEGAAVATATVVVSQDKRSRTVVRDPGSQAWVEVIPSEPGTPDGDLHAAREHLLTGSPGTAAKAVDRWIRDHGASHALYPDALLLKTQAWIAAHQFDEAHDLLTRFLNEFDGTSYVTEALRQEFVIAEAYLGGARRKFLGMRLMPGDDVGLRILDDMTANFPNDAHAELAIKTKADYFFRRGESSLAELEYTRLLNEYPQSRYHAYALRRAADCAQAVFVGPEYDEAPLIEAQSRFEEYARRYPQQAAEEGVPGIFVAIREARAEKLVKTAEYYERARHPKTAVFYYQLAVRDWSGTQAEAKARRRLDVLGVAVSEPGAADEASGGR
ncbi:MAG: hypothetical protein FLDDKLPJ_03026 [Phycisphaerae bacterium]|nr:hypothetical protein [Phycisphaerae bacterium]